MIQYVLAVACSEIQSAERAHAVLIHIVNAQIEQNFFAFFVYLLLGFARYLLHDFFNTGGMNPSVRYEPFKRGFRDFFAHRIEARNNDRFGSIVNNDIDSRERFKGADIPPFAADDAPFHFVARQRYRRNRYITGRFGCNALNCRNENVARFFSAVNCASCSILFKELERRALRRFQDL